MAKAKFSESIVSGVHKELKELEGKWKGTAKTWFEPDVLADESPVEGSIRSILGGRFIIHEYTGSIEGKTLEGIAIYGYDCLTGRFQSAWIDSFHMGTAIMFSESVTSRDNLDITGFYNTNELGTEKWGWRSELELKGDKLVLTAYNITPDGQEAKATEIIYERA
jgi:hypothetical protein